MPSGRRRAQQAQVGAARDQLFHQFAGWPGCLRHTAACAARLAVRHARAAAPRTPASGPAAAPGQPQFDPEHAADADRAVHADGAAHQFHQALGHHQADAGAFFRAGLLAQPVEGLEQLRQLSRRQSPSPVSRTLMRMRLRPRQALQLTTRPPGVLYLMALNSRLISTCLTRVRSASHEAGESKRGKSCDAALAAPAVRSWRGSRAAPRPATPVQRQRHLARLDQRQVEDLVDQLQQVPAGLAGSGRGCASAPASARRLPDSMSCAKPRMAFSGVRSSWLMLDRKSDFARLAFFGRLLAVAARRSVLQRLVQLRPLGLAACARCCRCRSAGSR
jgi:hypothetical protein